MLVGEAPGDAEDRFGQPFIGASGNELDFQLQRSGLPRADLFFTNVCHERPPNNEIEAFFVKKSKARKGHTLPFDTVMAVAALGELADENYALIDGSFCRPPILRGLLQLQRDIDDLQPRLIVAMGNTALWALTGLTGIMKWRGSILPAAGGPVDGHGIKLIPTIHPAFVLREMPLRAVAIQDLARASRESCFPEIRRPKYDFVVPKNVSEVAAWFAAHPTDALVADVENFYEEGRIHSGRLICIGFAASATSAICIPFARRAASGGSPHYWEDPADEAAVVALCRAALTTRQITFHNGLHDCQIIAGNWGFLPTFADDTMLMQHTAFPGMLGGKIDPITGRVSKKGSSLSLSFCSSMYCRYHRFWKDDGRGWDPSLHDELLYWHYNCEDCCRTWEIRVELEKILRKASLWAAYRFEMELFEPVFRMMFRGFNFDAAARRDFAQQISHDKKSLQRWLDAAVGHPLNVKSTPQMKDLFYGDFGLSPILHRKTRQPTLDDKALETLLKRTPVLRPIIERIQALRSLDTFEENYIDNPLSADGRLRFALNVAGIETFRFSSNSSAFGEGRSVQNLPRDPD